MPQSIGRYRVLQEIGRGGMAQVALATADGALGFSRDVVIKKLHEGADGRPDLRRRFVAEARLMALMPHPHIAQVIDLIEHEDGALYLVMEYVDGISLAATRKKVPWPIHLACFVIARLAEGLHFAHELRDPHSGARLGVVHRDVTPHNVLLSRYGEVKLTDFGVARSTVSEHETQDGVVVGKPAYLAPEQVRGEVLDQRADVFALGVTLFETLTGERPFEGRGIEVMHAIVHHAAPPPSSKRPQIPRALDDIVLAALHKDPKARTPSAAALGRQLDDWLADSGARAGGAELARWVEALLAADHADDTVTGAAAAVAKPASSPTQPLRAHADRPLPRRLSSFIGRDDVLAALATNFARGAQLVTLLGPGGIGKTRVALAYAQRLSGRVFFCDLTDATTVPAMCRMVGDALSVPVPAGSNVAVQIGFALAARAPALVVLDNFEQIADEGGATLAAWARAAPDIRFLVTSRARLNVPGEVVEELAPLALPTRGTATTDCEAVRLFVDRAGSQGVHLSKQQIKDAARLVALLEGVPLAVEIAAAETVRFTPRELYRRLLSPAEALDLGARGQPQPGASTDRHKSLRSAIAFSWQLLDEQERQALAQCACFRGGFALDAARAVLRIEGSGETQRPAWRVVRDLVDKSLLFEDGDAAGGRRFRMYLTIRAFAAERLGELDPEGATRQRHAHHYLEFGERCALAIDGPHGPQALEELDRERSNLLAVHRRAVQAGRTTSAAIMALRAALVLEPLLSAHGPLQTRHEVLDEALALADVPGVPARLASTLFELRGLARFQAKRIQEALADSARGIELAGDDHRLQGAALRQRGFVLIEDGQLTDAQHALQRAGVHAALAHDTLTLSLLRCNVGMLAWAFDELDPAIADLSAGLAALEEIGSQRLCGVMRGTLAAMLVERGRFDDADVMYQRAIDEIRRGGYFRYEAVYLAGRGLLRMERGDPTQADSFFQRALELARALGERELEALIQALHGASLAACDQLAPATAAFDNAAQLAAHPGDAFAVELVRGHLDAAEARAAMARGERDVAASRRESTQAKLDAARAALRMRREGASSGAGIDTVAASLLKTTARLLTRALEAL